MRRYIVIFMLLLLPVLMLAVNSFAHPAQLMKMSSQVRENLRGWRMGEQVTQTWSGTDWVNEQRLSLSYSEINPMAPISGSISMPNGPVWIPISTMDFTYDPTVHYVQDVVMNMMGVAFMKFSYSYDNQNRLTGTSMFGSDGAGGWVPANRMHVIYGAGTTFSVSQWLAAEESEPEHYEKMVFEFDSRGRISGEDDFTSPDSVNWVQTSHLTRTFHPHDTMTGAQFINDFAQIYPTIMLQDDAPFFGMATEEVYQEFNGTTLVNSDKATYSYDGSDNLTTMLEQYWTGDAWENSSQSLYTYDSNGNAITRTIQSWNMEWVNDEKYTMTWQHTDANDEHVQPVMNQLSLHTYPNPFTNSMAVNVSSKSSAPVTVEMFNIKGQLVLKKTAQANSSVNLDSRTLQSGVYFVKASQGNQTSTHKVIKFQ
jgi:hypothetical protein